MPQSDKNRRTVAIGGTAGIGLVLVYLCGETIEATTKVVASSVLCFCRGLQPRSLFVWVEDVLQYRALLEVTVRTVSSEGTLQRKRYVEGGTVEGMPVGTAPCGVFVGKSGREGEGFMLTANPEKNRLWHLEEDSVTEAVSVKCDSPSEVDRLDRSGQPDACGASADGKFLYWSPDRIYVRHEPLARSEVEPKEKEKEAETLDEWSLVRGGRITIRTARPGDANPIAAVWHESYLASHKELIPPGILGHRTLPTFQERTPAKIGTTIVAVRGSDEAVVGFATEGSGRSGELEQLFVAGSMQGSGVGGRLLRRLEERMASGGVQEAHLMCVKGNEAAIGFYKREGWNPRPETETYRAETADGTGFDLECYRFEKCLQGVPPPGSDERLVETEEPLSEVEALADGVALKSPP